jgi:dTDP-4-dehydrorhamnose 3,5-epimerase
MNLEVISLAIPDVKLVTPKKHGDARGFFSETYNRAIFADHGIALDFVQDNQSFSAQAGTLRGLHYQTPPFAQDKLIRVVRGRILDVAVDLRRGAPTFGKWVAAEISAEKWNQIFVPAGFAHGICTLEPNTEIFYKVTNVYSAQHDCGIRWNDPDLEIDWPFAKNKLVLSDKDARQPFLKNIATPFA